MEFQDDDFEKLKAEQEAAQNKKGYLRAAGAVLDNFQSIPSAYEVLWGRKTTPTPTASKVLGAAADGIADPMEQRQKAMEYMKLKRERALAQEADSPASPEMISFYEGVVPSMAGKFNGMTAAQLEKVSPVLMAKFRAEGDERMARMQAGQRAQEAAEARAFKKEELDLKRADAAMKKKELSGTAAKKKNLYDIGTKAEDQFNNAVEKGKTGGYDPTSSTEFIDNSSWAPNWLKSDASIEARSAQDSWIDSFLRDESGAAIPKDERSSYREIYFPMPGDSKQAVANKALLRKQKMDGAAEIAGIDAGSAPAQASVPKNQLTPEDQKAVNWALNNKGNPKAEKILNLHGIDSQTAVGSR